MTSKKKKIILIVSVVLLVLVYFGYKLINLAIYDVNNMSIDDYNKIVSGLKVNDIMTINTTKLENNDYLTYKNMKIKNDFKDFELKDNNDGRSVTYLSKDEETNQTKAIILSINEIFIDLLKSNKTLYIENDIRVNNLEVKRYLEKNNVNTDIELFEFLNSQRVNKINLFTPVSVMKENYKIHFITTVAFPVIKDITLLKGDYNGYIFNIENNVGIKDVSIIKNDKRYTITFFNTNYFTNDYINELLNTLIIE